jgi:hypothetical protein
VLISRTLEMTRFFTWATTGESFMQLFLSAVLVISRIVHVTWIGAVAFAVGMAQDTDV